VITVRVPACYPEAVGTLTKDQGQLLTFFDFPAEHWFPSRKTNPAESSFATVSARTKVTKDAGSRKAGLAMAFQMLLAAGRRWRSVNAPHVVAPARADVKCPNGWAEMLPLEPSDNGLFVYASSMYGAEEVSIHNIRRFLFAFPIFHKIIAMSAMDVASRFFFGDEPEILMPACRNGVSRNTLYIRPSSLTAQICHLRKGRRGRLLKVFSRDLF